MNTPDQKPSSEGRASSQPLEKSENEASRTQPRSFDKEGMEDKKVEIPPRSADHPIRGLDNRPESNVDSRK
jgi:hypothetical protein